MGTEVNVNILKPDFKKVKKYNENLKLISLFHENGILEIWFVFSTMQLM